jgi:hydrogenase maturation protease
MLIDPVEKIANAVLYEGYILYPYRASAVKNRQRFNFGALYPAAHCRTQSGADADTMQIECLVSADEGADVTVEARVRFLQLQSRDVFRRVSPPGDAPDSDDPAAGAADPAADSNYELVDSLVIAGHIHQTWQEAVERDIVASGLSLADLASRHVTRQTHLATRETHLATRTFLLPGSHVREPLTDVAGAVVGQVVRRQRELTGAVTLAAERLDDRVFKLRVTVTNSTPLASSAVANRDELLLATFISTHAILRVAGGEFVSLLEPPDELRSAAAACRNLGAWPVLAGEPGERDRMLASPIILYDYPRVAPESSGDWCDGAEIDEMLMLRVMTLTGDEKIAMRDVDRRAREILERAESMSEDQMLKLHGALRGLDRGGAARSGEEAAR